MSTYADLINSIHTSLHSYTGLQEVSSWLTANVDTDDLTFPLAGSDTILRGIAEVDSELVYVHTSDSGGAQIAPFGRGYRGSTAAAHTTNTQVVFDPIFPRVEIKRAVADCVKSLFPMLYQIKSVDVTWDPVQVGYELPADCTEVLEVKWQYTDMAMNYWEQLQRWDFDPKWPEGTGKALRLYDWSGPVTSFRVDYAADFGTFAADTDTLASVGLSESYSDMILYCVTSRMIRFLDMSRLQTSSVENLSRAQVVASGDGAKIANQLYAMYQQRMAEERSRLLQLTPASIHYTR